MQQGQLALAQLVHMSAIIPCAKPYVRFVNVLQKETGWKLARAATANPSAKGYTTYISCCAHIPVLCAIHVGDADAGVVLVCVC